MDSNIEKKFLCFKKSHLTYYIIAAVLIGVIVSSTSCFFFDCKAKIYSTYIEDFDECANAGFPVVANDPPRCLLSEDIVFVRDPQHIRIFEPKKNDVMLSPFEIKGEARALNNMVGFELKDQNGELIKNGTIQANSPEHGRWGDYSKEIEFETNTEKGVLEVFDITSEKTKININSVPVFFKEDHEEVVQDEEIEETSNRDPLENASKEIPQKASLQVPFTAQAPYQDWNPPFDEACEEASVIMVNYYLEGKTLNKETANNRIILMTDWQANNGYEIDIDTEEVKEVVESYYDNRIAFVYKDDQVNIENIKILLNAGYPVIVPAAGQMLENPNFRGAGPPYHMLVITGYDDKYFYTNDPGTRNGENFRYTYENLMASIHDWTGSKSTISQGKKAMIIMDKK